MAITYYRFGRMVVDGKTYERDILIGPDKEVKSWRTKFSHEIQLGDIQDLLGESTRIIIFGIGADKGCWLNQEVLDYTRSKGIEVHILNTFDAVRKFNSLPKEGLSACFHLNC